MKTTSIKSMAALFGLAIALNANSFAGPGPQLPQPSRKVGEPKKSIVTVALTGTPHESRSKSAIAEPKLTQVSGPHGVTFVYRSANASGL
jgi:hypothetical protein